MPPPADTILDDMAIPMAMLRAGYRVVFEPDALAEEAGSGSAVRFVVPMSAASSIGRSRSCHRFTRRIPFSDTETAMV